MATIQEVYIALFGRPADPAGLEYYVDVTNDGANLDAVGDLSASEEYTDRFDGFNDVQKVNAIYQDLFGRDADASGLAFYVGLLNSGAATEQDIAIRILDGATDDDAEIIANKVEAANAFTASIDTEVEIGAYKGEAAADLGRAFLTGITSDPATIPDQAAIDDAIEQIVVGVGETFPLTTGDDEFTGGINGDTFNAESGELNTDDVLDGGSSIDTLNVTQDGGTLVTPVTLDPTLTSIERVYVTEDQTDTAGFIDLDLSKSTGVQQVWSRDSEAGDSLTVTDGSDDITYGVEGVATPTGGIGTFTYNVELDDDGDLKLAVNGSNGNTIDFNTTGGGDVDSVSLAALGESESIVDLASFGDAETVTLTGSGELDVTLNAGVEELDLSDYSGDLTARFGANDENLDLELSDGDNTIVLTGSSGDNTVTGGDGADDIRGGSGESNFSGGEGEDTLVAGTGESVLEGGDGNDILGGNTGNATLTGGAGSDEFHFNASMTSGSDDVNTVTDFNAGEDVISLLKTTGTFGSSVDDGINGTSDLDDEDFNLIGDLTQINTVDVNGEVVVSTGDFADSAAIDTAVGGIVATDTDSFYLVAYNEDAGNAQLYFVDGNGASASSAVLLADINDVDAAGVAGLTADNFDIYL